MYDVSCKLGPSITKWFPESASNFRYAVNAFHIYTHIWDCQQKFSPKFIEDWGLTDGEGVERFWSYMSGYIPISRPMRDSSRKQLFLEASRFYTYQKNKEMGKFLVRKLENVTELASKAKSIMDPQKNVDYYKAAWELYVNNDTRLDSQYNGNIQYVKLRGYIAEIRNFCLIMKLVEEYNKIVSIHFFVDPNIHPFINTPAFFDALRNNVSGGSIFRFEVDEGVLAWQFGEMVALCLYTMRLCDQAELMAERATSFDNKMKAGAAAFVRHNYLQKFLALPGENFDAMYFYLPNFVKSTTFHDAIVRNKAEEEKNEEEKDDEEERDEEESFYYPEPEN
ncbi:hypothetical protein [Parasitella parasitica]|uniref:Uncharacterized protein n=1 Tax=Parasitella parasitica TaxID=35722 RepID=A0A0B7N851_9FUNG|nr:hypothetical protein [Parasitella parasitica]